MQSNVLRAHSERIERRNKDRQAELRSPLNYVVLFATILSIYFGSLPVVVGSSGGHYVGLSISLTICAITAAMARQENRSLVRRIEALESQLNGTMRND